MKKITKIVLALLLTANFLHAEEEFAIGPLFDIGNNNTNGNTIDVTVKYNEWKFDIGNNIIGIDKLFVEDDLVGEIRWFFGLGIYSDFDFISMGVRIPLGLAYDIGSNFDIFIQNVFYYSIEPVSGSNWNDATLGLRYYF